MTIYAVEKDGIKPFIGFQSKGEAITYVLQAYANEYLTSMINENTKGYTEITRADIETIKDDICTLCKDSYIADYFYIHKIEVKENDNSTVV